MKKTDDTDLSPDGLAAASAVAKRDILPALKQAADRHGPIVLVGTFVMLAEILAGFGAGEGAAAGSPVGGRGPNWTRYNKGCSEALAMVQPLCDASRKITSLLRREGNPEA
jgi:hypothetical protein